MLRFSKSRIEVARKELTECGGYIEHMPLGVADAIQRSSTVGELLYSGECSNEILNLFTAGMCEDHTALCNGYLSRSKNTCEIHKYSGKFGTGVVVYTPNTKSSRYCYKTYYIEIPMQ